MRLAIILSIGLWSVLGLLMSGCGDSRDCDVTIEDSRELDALLTEVTGDK